MPKKYFTVEEAQKLIPKIKKSFSKIISLKKAIDAISSIQIDVNEIDFDEFEHMNTKLGKEFHKLCYEFYREMGILNKTGCIIKDLELGLVDFFCRFEGRDIFLCWKLGEDKISFWHELDEGFQGRQRILDFEELKNL